MDKDIKKMKKMVDFMRKQGVLSVKMGEMHLELSPLAIFPDQKLDPKEVKEQTPPPEDLIQTLLWSSPGSLPEGLVQ